MNSYLKICMMFNMILKIGSFSIDLISFRALSARRLVVDLRGQLPGGRQDQRPHAGGPLRTHPAVRRHQEAQRLAAAGPLSTKLSFSHLF